MTEKINEALETVTEDLKALSKDLQSKCDHGVTFDEEAALKLLEGPSASSGDPALDFIMGHSSSGEIRKRWPRLCGLCPKGCGYNGIAYASYAHYIYGDW